MAVTCPHCGAPVDIDEEELLIKENEEEAREKRQDITIRVVVFLVFAFIALWTL